jgi:hypothetical protein
MNADWLLGNLMAWSAQLCVLTAVAAGAALALKTPRTRLWFWQAMLGIALLLPFVQPWVTPRDPAGNITISSGPGVPGGDSLTYSGLIFRREYVLALIAAGTALRLLWIAIGFLRLRRHRLAARVLPDPPFASARVRWYLSDTVSGPVTFGWLRPSILLPSRVNELGKGLREAIACHELIHVERRDWLLVVLEELIRAALWFHPAIWFLLGQIQLSREQTVDGEVVRRTGDREKYLDALVAVAEQKFSPAPLFLKKRQLAVRVAAVLKETQVSRSGLTARFATVFSAALVAARLAMWFFPMQSPAQTTMEADDQAITVDPGAPLLHRTAIHRAPGAAPSGSVIVEAVVDAKGLVNEVRALSGPDGLRQAVLESVAEWHYATEPAPPSVIRITVNFGAAPVWRTQPLRGTVTAIRFMGIPPQLEREIRARLPFHAGDEIDSGASWFGSSGLGDLDERLSPSEEWSVRPPPQHVVVSFLLGAW